MNILQFCVLLAKKYKAVTDLSFRAIPPEGDYNSSAGGCPRNIWRSCGCEKLLIIATGGTIASVSTAAGLTPNISGEDLVANVPLINELCAFDFIQPMNIDSTNMRPRDWIHLCRDIIENYDNYDGFVILHGTDTMAYRSRSVIPYSE